VAVLRREDGRTRSTADLHDVHTILGDDCSFKGRLVFQGTVRIDGHFQGEVVSEDILIIGQGARVEGRLEVGSVIINGQVCGEIIARELIQLNASAMVGASLVAPEIMMARGAQLKGSIETKVDLPLLNRAGEQSGALFIEPIEVLQRAGV
jgi:cytoskeletal protein CcmA (bactofilin family)